MSTTREERIEWAEIVGKSLLFPDAAKFEDLFRSVYLNREEAPTNLTIEKDGSNYPTGINSWCHRHLRNGHYVSTYLGPQAGVLEAILDSLVVPDLSLYFTIVDRGDNVSLVTIQYDQIIASRWLAFIDTDSIPEGTS